MKWLRKHYVNLFFVIGAVHMGAGTVQFWTEFVDLFEAGFFAEIDEKGYPYQAVGYWFQILGMLFIGAGFLVRTLLRETGRVPREFSWILVLTSLVGVLAFPLNGLWSTLALGLIGLGLAERETLHQVAARQRETPRARPTFEV